MWTWKKGERCGMWCQIKSHMSKFQRPKPPSSGYCTKPHAIRLHNPALSWRRQFRPQKIWYVSSCLINKGQYLYIRVIFITWQKSNNCKVLQVFHFKINKLHIIIINILFIACCGQVDKNEPLTELETHFTYYYFIM